MREETEYSPKFNKREPHHHIDYGEAHRPKADKIAKPIYENGTEVFENNLPLYPNYEDLYKVFVWLYNKNPEILLHKTMICGKLDLFIRMMKKTTRRY